MGMHGMSGDQEMAIGSNTFQVIKCANCPVLAIPGNWDRQYFRKIVFPVRLIKGTLEKYNFIQPIVEKNDSEIIIIGLADSDRPDHVAETAILIDRLKLLLHNDNVKFTTRFVPTKDFPAQVIETADEFDADLIVISSDLDHKYKEYLRGPYAQEIINTARRPVLSIRPKLEKSKYYDDSKGLVARAIDKYLSHKI
jgi:nucleotide-binding universal stress UspA family protein